MEVVRERKKERQKVLRRQEKEAAQMHTLKSINACTLSQSDSEKYMAQEQSNQENTIHGNPPEPWCPKS
jgi:hypothetical protein